MSESNRHDKGSAWGWVSAWLGVALILVTAVSTSILAFDREWLGVSLGVILLWEIIPAVARRFGLEMHRDEIEARAQEVMASDTGTWRLFIEGEAPERFTVRWDAWGRQYVVKGPDLEFNTWVDSLTLAGIIEGQERAGWVPNDDEATRAIRARLDLPARKREDTL